MALPRQPDVVRYRWLVRCLHVPCVLPTLPGKCCFFCLCVCLFLSLTLFITVHPQQDLIFPPFSFLIQSIQRKFGSITHASVRFLGERLQRMGNQFLSSLEVMTSRSQCPTVLLDAETVRLRVTPTPHCLSVSCPIFLCHVMCMYWRL